MKTYIYNIVIFFFQTDSIERLDIFSNVGSIENILKFMYLFFIY